MQNDPITIFQKNLADVDRLVNFDKEVLQVVTVTIEDLHNRLKGSFASDQMNGGRALAIVKGIRDNESLQTKYAAIFNQAVVLVVSHFSSTLGDLFRRAVNEKLTGTGDSPLLAEEVKITFSELREKDWNLRSTAADLLIAKHDFTFQDMGSTVRAFDKFIGVRLERDVVMNNIITTQACRHVIAHASGRVNARTLKQVMGATPRTLKPHLAINEQLQFSPAEIESIRKDMLAFVERLNTKLTENSSTEN
jgi:hypothetical protein